MKAINAAITMFAVIATLPGCSGQQPPVNNQETFFLLPDGTSREFRRELGSEVLAWIGEHCAAGDVVHFIRVPGYDPLTTVVVPAGSANRRLRNPVVHKQLRELVKYIKAETVGGSQQVELPSLPTMIRSLRCTNFPVRVIIAGTPIYDNSKHQGWGMVGGMVPTDGSLDSPTCPFGSGVADFPPGTKAVWWPPKVSFGVDHVHQEAVTRFYRLFFDKHGAKLTHMTSDINATLHAEGSQFTDTVVPQDDGVGMRFAALQASERVVVNRSEFKVPGSDSTLPGHQPSRPEPALTTEIPVEVPRAAEQVLIAAEHNQDKIAFAINWESADRECDIDMRILSSGSSQELNYVHKKTSFGKLFRDVRSSGSISDDGSNFRNWEWAEINHNRLKDLTLWLNAYRTQKPATVRVICVWKGQRHEQTIKIAGPGDKGGAFLRSWSAAWHKVNLQW